MVRKQATCRQENLCFPVILYNITIKTYNIKTIIILYCAPFYAWQNIVFTLCHLSIKICPFSIAARFMQTEQTSWAFSNVIRIVTGLFWARIDKIWKIIKLINARQVLSLNYWHIKQGKQHILQKILYVTIQ